MKQARTLTNEEYIIELLEMLTQNQRKEDANLLYEICSHIESMESKLAAVEKELEQVTKQMNMMHGGGTVEKTKETVTAVAGHLQEQSSKVKIQISQIKATILDTAKNIVEGVKQKGKEALYRVAEFAKIKEKMSSLRNKVESNIKDVNGTIDKITEFTSVVRTANQQVKNAARTLADKEEKDYSKQTGNTRMTELLTMPWRVQRGLLAGIDMHAESIIEAVEQLSKHVERKKDTEKGREEEMEHVTGDVVDAPVVAEESAYGLDAFDAYVEKNGTEKLQERIKEGGGGSKKR